VIEFLLDFLEKCHNRNDGLIIINH